jgi:hypothetical protein
MRMLWLALAVFAFTAEVARAASIPTNSTNMTWDSGHGTQVEYVSADGRTFLWYPGNKVILPGHWKMQGRNVCFLYGANTYNPVTKVVGAVWECEPTNVYGALQTERAKGDVFGLSTRGAVPFILTNIRTTIGALAGQMGVRSPATEKITVPLPAAPGMKPSDPPEAQCAAIIAQAHSSKTAMTFAGLTYFHGMWLGKPCVTVDYAKAFGLLREAGDTQSINALTTILKQRAAGGNPKAINALEKLGISR